MLARVTRPRDLCSDELLLAAIVRRALKDATCGDPKLRDEACERLWMVVPSIAERAGLQLTPIVDSY